MGLFLFRDEFQGNGINTISQSGGRWTILEYMSEMGITAGTGYLRAYHTKTAVPVKVDNAVRFSFEEAGPAATGFELCHGSEKP